MPLSQVLLRSQCFLGCVVFLALPIQIRTTPPQQVSLVVYGVERQRKNDNLYDQQWLTELTKQGFDPILYSSKSEMVEKVLGRLGPCDCCIQKLNLYGHGNVGRFMMGKGQSDSWLGSTYIFPSRKGNDEINDWRAPMGLLKGRFCKDAEVSLYGCYTGADEEGAATLFELAQFWGVTVRAPVSEVFGGIDYKGDWQKATQQMTQPPSPKLPPG